MDKVSKSRKKYVNRMLKEAKQINDLIIESTKKLDNGNFNQNRFLTDHPSFMEDLHTKMDDILKEMSEEMDVPTLSVYAESESKSLIDEAEGLLNI